MAVPLLLGAAKGLLANTAKNAVKNKALGAAKNFVSGKKKKERGGALVKRETVGSSQGRSKARVKATQTYTGGSVSSDSSSAVKAKVAPGGEVSYEKLTEQLNNMVGVSEALNKAIASQYKSKEKQVKKKKKAIAEEKREEKEEKLESKKEPARGLGILAGIGAAGSKFGIFNFLLNTLLGGLALLFINNFDTIKEFFGGLGDAFSNKMNLLRWGLTSLRGPIQLVATKVAKVFKPVLKRLGSGLKRGMLGVGDFVGNGLRRIGTGVYNFAKKLLSRVTGAGSSTARTLASSGTRGATNAAAGTAKQLGTGTASKAAKKTFTNQGAKRLGMFSKAFKKIPLVGPIIGIGIDLAMGETLDRAIVGAIGAGLGSTIGAFIGQGLIPIPGLGALIGGVVGAGIGDYLAKELYGNIAKNLVGEGLSPLGSDEVTQEMIDNRSDMKPGDKREVQGSTKVWTGYGFVSPSEWRRMNRRGTRRSAAAPTGSLNITGAKTTYYDPSLGGINASGYKTPDGLPATSTGEGYRPEVFSAAAFPPLLAMLPQSMTTPARNFPGGRTIKRPFNVIVTNSDGKQAILRVNDVGPGVEGHSSNHMLDLSVAAKNYLGTGQGFSIQMADSSATPGPIQSLLPAQVTAPAPASTSSGGLTNVVPTLNFEKIGAGSGSVGMTSGRGQRWGKHHAGVDIGTSGEKGWYVAFKLSGKVTDVGTYSRYGKTVIVTSGGKDFLFAHLASIMVKKGDVYNGEIIGEIGNTGSGTGEHLHFEVSPEGTGGYKKDEDPMPYVKYLQIGRLDPSGTPTQTTRLQPSTSTADRAQRVQQRASYEGAGSQVVTVPIPAGGQQQVMASGSGAGTIVMGGSTRAMVNSYYKAQLMGFLYKQG